MALNGCANGYAFSLSMCWTSLTLQRMEENPDSDRHYERTTDDPSPSGQGTKQKSDETPLGDHNLPIMQWEDLSLRIAELERQEEERRTKAEVTFYLDFICIDYNTKFGLIVMFAAFI